MAKGICFPEITTSESERASPGGGDLIDLMRIRVRRCELGRKEGKGERDCWAMVLIVLERGFESIR